MKGTRYILTARREDVLELYENQFTFHLFAKENHGRLTYIALFGFGLIAASFNLFHYGDRSLPIIACSIAIGYNAVMLFNAYRKAKQVKQSVNDWIDSFMRYKEHSIVIGENSFTYYRDTQVHRYDLSMIKQKHSDGAFFKLKLTDGEWIMFPAKSFEAGKFEEFVACVDDMVRVGQTTK